TLEQQPSTGTTYLDNVSCSFNAGTVQCTGRQRESGVLRVRMTAHARNVAMAMRRIDVTQGIAQYKVSGTWLSSGTTTSAAGALNSSDGSGTIYFNVTFPDRSDEPDLKIQMAIGLLADHALLDSGDSTTGWFVRNEWYRLAYYAVAPGHTAASLPSAPACTTGINCLSVTNVTPANAQRAILILAGRSINGSTRPSTELENYLESSNVTGNATRVYTRNSVNAGNGVPVAQRFNDRVVVIGSNL